MKIYTKYFYKNLLKYSLIGLVFLVSCGQEGTQEGVAVKEQQEETVEWFKELGFKKVMVQMKKDSQLLTRRIGEEDWEEAVKQCSKVGKSFGRLDLNNPILPKDFAEFKEIFEKSLSKLLIICQNKGSGELKKRLEIYKRACHYCHIMYRKKLNASDTSTDFGVALERIYKDGYTSD